MIQYAPFYGDFRSFCATRPPNLQQEIRGLGLEISDAGYAVKIPVTRWSISVGVVYHFYGGSVQNGWAGRWKNKLDEPVVTPGQYDPQSENVVNMADRNHVYLCDMSCQSAVHGGLPLGQDGYLYCAPWAGKVFVLSVGITVKEPEFSEWLKTAKFDVQGNPTFEDVVVPPVIEPVEKKQTCTLKDATQKLIIQHPAAVTLELKPEDVATKTVFFVRRT